MLKTETLIFIATIILAIIIIIIYISFSGSDKPSVIPVQPSVVPVQPSVVVPVQPSIPSIQPIPTTSCVNGFTYTSYIVKNSLLKTNSGVVNMIFGSIDSSACIKSGDVVTVSSSKGMFPGKFKIRAWPGTSGATEYVSGIPIKTTDQFTVELLTADETVTTGGGLIAGENVVILEPGVDYKVAGGWKWFILSR